MRWRLTLFVLLLTAVPYAFGQTIYWERQTLLQGPLTAESPFGTQDAQGNTYIAGLAEAQLYVEKVNANGTLAWRYLEQSTTYWDTSPSAIAVNANGDLFVGGGYRIGGASGAGTAFLLAFGPTGSLKWRAQLPNNVYARQITISGSGDPIVSSYAGSPMYLSRLSDADGHVVWTQQFNSGSYPAIASKGGFTYALLAPNTFVRVDESTGNTIWSQTPQPSAGFSQLTPVNLDVLPSGDMVYAGQNLSAMPNGYVEKLSQSDGSSLGRVAIPASIYSSNGNQAVIAADDGSVVWNGFANVQGGTRGMAGKLSSTLQSLWTIEPGAHSFLAAPLSNGTANVIYQPNPPNTTPLRFTQVDASRSLSFDSDTGTGQLSYWVSNLCAFSSNSVAVIGTSYDSRNNTVNTTSSFDAAGNVHLFKDTAPVGTVNNEAVVVDHDAQGNLYVGSIQGSFCSVSKYNINGDLIWTTPIGGNPNSGSLAGWPIGQPASISYSPRGEVVLALLCNMNSGMFGVAKLDATTGKPLIVRLAGNRRGMYYMPAAIKEDSNGDIVLAGGEADSSTGTNQLEFVAKFSGSTGSWQWLKEFSGFVLAPYPIMPPTNHSGLVMDPSDNILLSGIFQGVGSVSVNTMKLNPTGTTVYSNSAGIGTQSSQGTAIVCDAAGNAYVFATTSTGFQVLVYGPSGSTLRQSAIASSVLGGSCGNLARVFYTPQRNALTLVASASTSGVFATLQLNASTLAKNWEDDCNTYDHANDCAVDANGNVVIVGGHSYYLPWIRKLRADTGGVVYSSHYQGAYSREGSGWAVTIGPDFYPVMVGNSDGPFGHGTINRAGPWGQAGFLVKFRG